MSNRYMFERTKALSRYVMSLHNIQKNKNIDKKVDEIVLNEFILNKELNIYKCHKSINEKHKELGYQATYKTIHTKVHELASLGLIEKAEDKRLNYGATEYHLSTYGLYYVVKCYPELLTNIKLLDNNREDELFKIFLYPYLQRDTIIRINNEYITHLVFDFLSRICRSITGMLMEMKKIEYDGGFLYHRGKISYLVDDDEEYVWDDYDDWKYAITGPKSFVGYLNENFDLKWKDKSLVKIESIKGYEIIKIFDKERELILSIDPILKKAILSENQKIIFEFNITQSEENEYYLQEFVPMTVEDFLDEEGDYIFGSLKVPIEELCWNLAYHCDRISEYEVSSEKKLEMSLLVNDENFIKSLMLVKKGVRSKMQMLDKILEMNTSSM